MPTMNWYCCNGPWASHELRGHCRQTVWARMCIAGCLVFLTTLLIPCLPTNAAAKPTIEFLAAGLPYPGSTDVGSMATRRVLRAFRKKYPQYRIKAFAMPTIQGSSMDTGPLMAIAAGMPPNALYVNFRQSSTYIEHGFLAPMEVLLARVLSKNAALRHVNAQGRWLANPRPVEIAQALKLMRRRVPKTAWPVIYRRGTGREKHVWSMPTSILVTALLYRKDLFRAAGLNPRQPPRTWTQLLQDARKLTIPSRRQYGIAFGGGRDISYSIFPLLASNSSRVIERNSMGRWHSVYDSPQTAQAIYYFCKLAKGRFMRDGHTIHGAAYVGVSGAGNMYWLWSQGHIAMMFGTLSQELIQATNPQIVGIAPVPHPPGGASSGELNATMLGVFAKSTPQQQIGVMRYIWFITGRQAQRLSVQTFVQSGYGQFVNPDLLRRFGYTWLLRQVPAGWATAFDTALANGVPEPYQHNTQNIYSPMSTPINSALEENLGNLPQSRAIPQINRLLKQASQRIDYQLLGAIPLNVIRLRRFIAMMTILVIGAVFLFELWRVWQYFTRADAIFTSRAPWRRFLGGYTLLLPAFLLMILWAYLPLAGGLAMAFSHFELVQHSTWAGVDNFAKVLFDARFWGSFGRTIYFVALTIGLGFWPPILLAILLQEVPTATLKYIFRTVYYLPSVISGVLIMFLWRQLYDPSKYGVLNHLLLMLNLCGAIPATVIKLLALGLWISLIALLMMLPIRIQEMSRPVKAALWVVAGTLVAVTLQPVVIRLIGGGPMAGLDMFKSLIGPFHIAPLGWIQSPDIAMLCVVLPTIWAGSGAGSILYLAALKTVPDELYEAAEMDGARIWHKIFYITLPQLKYLIVIQFIAAVIGTFQGGTDYILALTGGGPNHSTLIIPLEIFFRTFLKLQFGVGTAMAWLLGIILIWFTATQLKMLSKAEFKGGR
ncbi:MAG: extracellular solute-binding protein [Phycisphaerae bacterium]|nr:extracellular solute-binding protein [Phycisphaerae bacterium]